MDTFIKALIIQASIMMISWAILNPFVAEFIEKKFKCNYLNLMLSVVGAQFGLIVLEAAIYAIYIII